MPSPPEMASFPVYPVSDLALILLEKIARRLCARMSSPYFYRPPRTRIRGQPGVGRGQVFCFLSFWIPVPDLVRDDVLSPE